MAGIRYGGWNCKVSPMAVSKGFTRGFIRCIKSHGKGYKHRYIQVSLSKQLASVYLTGVKCRKQPKVLRYECHVPI
jgi:hypothetical protein